MAWSSWVVEHCIYITWGIKKENLIWNFLEFKNNIKRKKQNIAVLTKTLQFCTTSFVYYITFTCALLFKPLITINVAYPLVVLSE